jgi:TetR/AcrR family transcriptional regulator, transcriptional repressor for nem operon
MRVSREVMARRHDEIIVETSKMLRQRGIGGSSLADLMAAVGLTHGAFYKHFESKEALVAEATARVFEEIQARFESRSKSQGAKAALKLYVRDYLSMAHLKNPELGCAFPSFGSDVGREDGKVKSVFTQGTRTLLSLITDGMSCPQAERHGRAIELISILSGAILIARATDDEKLVSDIIATARKRATALIEAKR